MQRQRPLHRARVGELYVPKAVELACSKHEQLLVARQEATKLSTLVMRQGAYRLSHLLSAAALKRQTPSATPPCCTGTKSTQSTRLLGKTVDLWQ